MRLFRSARRPTSPVPHQKSRLRLELLEERTLLSGLNSIHTNYILRHPAGQVAPLGTSGPTGTSVNQIRHAYGFDQISFGGVAADGSGTTIAIVDAFDNPNIASDLHQFDLQFGLPDPVFTKVNQSGGTTPPAADSGWASEIALDVQWAHAIAPGAKILLVEANDNSSFNLYNAVAFAARQTNVVAVSMSWGGGEYSTESASDSTFLTPSGHNGVTFVASSGDSGAPPEYPSISPNVLAVGGTTLNLDSQGNIFSEYGWSGSGGGISTYEAQPAYQKGVVTQSTTRRTNPDVAYDADPNTGFPVYDSFNNGSTSPWSQFGGTSDAAPQWAALIAIADQGRAIASLGSLDGRSQILPLLYQLSSTDFRDITAGTSFGFPFYRAGPGYDLVTGRGTPLANKIVADLAGPAAPTVTHFSISAPASSTAGAAFSITVTALDQNNNKVAGYTGTVHFSSSDGQAIVPGNYTFGSGDAGIHTFTNAVILKTAGNQTITATDTATNSIAGSATVGVSAAAATHYKVSAPAGATSGVAFNITVTALDAFGNTSPSYTGTVHFSSSDGQAILPGNYTFGSGDAGAHTFTNAVILKSAGNQTITATDTIASSIAGSATVAVSAPVPTSLRFGQQPSNTAAGIVISTVTVQVLDANNNPITGDNTDLVSLTLNNANGATLGGTTQNVAVQNGVATFSNLIITKTGSYTLTASSGSLASATSSSFTITPGSADHLVFAQQPTTTAVGAKITPAVTVQIQDLYNNLLTSDNTDPVTLTLASNPSGAVLSGTNPVTVSGGVATFSDLSVNLAGSGYSLGAGSGSLKAATSASFDVAAALTAIEDFEHGLGLYHSTSFSTYRASSSAAHDGSLGLDMASSMGWIYRNDPAAQVQQGQTLSVWVQFASFTVGRAYFGFGASASGALSVVLAADTHQLIIQNNSGYRFLNLAATAQSYVPSHWYRLEVVWGTGGSITGRLYDSNGTTLLNSVQATDNSITAGGIAFLASVYDKYFDTVTAVNTPGARTVRLGTGGAAANGPHVTVPAGSGSEVLASFVLPGSAFSSLATPVAGSSAELAASGPAMSSTAVLLAPIRQQSGAGGDSALLQEQDDHAQSVTFSDPTRESASLDATGWMAVAQDRLVTDAYFAGTNAIR